MPAQVTKFITKNMYKQIAYNIENVHCIHIHNTLGSDISQTCICQGLYGPYFLDFLTLQINYRIAEHYSSRFE